MDVNDGELGPRHQMLRHNERRSRLVLADVRCGKFEFATLSRTRTDGITSTLSGKRMAAGLRITDCEADNSDNANTSKE